MRFKVTTKDFIIFIIFCIFLFLLCSLAVLNVTSLLNEGEFFGLNPFPGFLSPYLGATVVVFLAVLIAIFFSVSSYIFDHEKGSGFGIKFGEKDEKGYSRWAKVREIKTYEKVERIVIKEPTATAAGVPLINDGKEMWVDNGESHTLVIGATGSGKTTAIVNPLVYSLAKKGESMVLTDPKGELYRDHSEMLKSKGYNIIILNFRNPSMGNAWNPLILPYQLYKAGNTDKATELLEDVALNILYDPENKNDPFWEKSAADFFSGLALGLFEDAKESQINLNSINYMSTVGEENFATSNYTKEYFSLKGESASAYVFASNTINAPTETKGSILSVFRQKIRLFSSREQLSEMLSHSDFNMRDIGKQKTAVFMVIHDEKTTYHALATIFIKQCYETLIDVAQENGGKLPFRTNFVLDEFANMPPLKDVTTMVTAARSRQIRFTFIIQNFAQLNEVYGKENAETIRSNCGNLMYLLTTELAALEEISKLCGEVKSKEKDKTASTPLITVSDLQKLKMNEVVIIKNRLNPFRTKLTPSYEIDWGGSYGKGDFKERDKQDVDLFDIKEFVKIKKRNKLFEALDGASKSNEPKEEKKVNAVEPPKEENAAHEIPKEEPKNNEDLFKSFNPFNSVSDEPKEESISKDNNEIKLEPDTVSNVEEDKVDNQIKPKFDVDELVKRIDAKIAELEAQEKNNEAPKTNNNDESYDKLENTIYEKFDDFMKNDTKENTSKDEPVVKVDTDSVIMNDNSEPDVTDDQYFDDFFNNSDEEK